MMKSIWIAFALVLPASTHAALPKVSLPSYGVPQIISLPVFPIGPASPARLPSLPSARAILPSLPLPVFTVGGPAVRLPGKSHPLQAGAGLLLADAGTKPENEPKSDKLDKVYDGSGRKQLPSQGRPRGNRNYYPVPGSDLLDEIGVR